VENVLQSFKKILFSGRKYGKWSSIERDIKLYGTWKQHVFYQRLLVRIFISKWLLRCLFEKHFFTWSWWNDESAGTHEYYYLYQVTKCM